MGSLQYGIDPERLKEYAQDIKAIIATGVQVAIVIGGGNIFRGAGLAEAGLDRVTGDNIGMLATVINSLALQDAIEKLSVQCRVMSAVRINQISEDYIRRRAIRHLEKDRIVIFAAGTGNPFFTTDTAASLRAIEINADMVLKATKVDGVYDKDPEKYKDAKLFKELTYNEVLSKELKVMDTTAVVLCKENNIPLRVFNMLKKGSLMSIINGENTGTVIK